MTPQVTATANLMTAEQIEAEFNWSERTRQRYQALGFPTIAVGHKIRLYDPVRIREWLMTHERRHDVPRRGRPANRAAA